MDSPSDVERIKELLEYRAGNLFWKKSNSNRVQVGSKAGSLHPSGYIHVFIDRKMYKAHHIVWALHYGSLPTAEIDHIDGCRHNNLFINLRECTHSENQQNIKKRRGTTSQFIGVYKHGKRWRSSIAVDGCQRHLGYFDLESDAYAAYLIAKEQMHPFQPNVRE